MAKSIVRLNMLSAPISTFLMECEENHDAVNKCVFRRLNWHLDVSHAWQEHSEHAEESRETAKQCERENCM